MTDPRVAMDPLEKLRAEEADLLLTEVGGRAVALPAAAVAEILDPLPVTPLPGAPAHVEGVIDVRSTVAPLYDLRRRLQATSTEPGSQMLLLRSTSGDAGAGQRRRMALRVDRVLEILHVTLGDVAPPPELAGGTDRFVLGVLRFRGAPILLLDIDEILSTDEHVALDELLRKLDAGETAPVQDPGAPGPPAAEDEAKVSGGRRRRSRKSEAPGSPESH